MIELFVFDCRDRQPRILGWLNQPEGEEWFVDAHQLRDHGYRPCVFSDEDQIDNLINEVRATQPFYAVVEVDHKAQKPVGYFVHDQLKSDVTIAIAWIDRLETAAKQSIAELNRENQA